MEESWSKSLGTFLDERLSNPVVGTFILAWCGWNYKLFVILFSKASVSETFALIAKEYPTWTEQVLGKGFLCPALSVLLYFLAVPWITTKYYKWTATARKAQDEARYEAEKHKRLTLEQGAELEEALRRTRDELARETTNVERLKTKISEAEQKDQAQTLGITNMQTQLNEKDRHIEEQKKASADRIAAEIEARRNRNTDSITQIFRTALNLDGNQAAVLKAIASMESGALVMSATDHIFPLLSRAEVSTAIQELIDKSLVVSGVSAAGPHIALRQEGLEVLIQREALEKVRGEYLQFSESEPLATLEQLKWEILTAAAQSHSGIIARPGLDSLLPNASSRGIDEALTELVSAELLTPVPGIVGGGHQITVRGSEALSRRPN